MKANGIGTYVNKRVGEKSSWALRVHHIHMCVLRIFTLTDKHTCERTAHIHPRFYFNNRQPKPILDKQNSILLEQYLQKLSGTRKTQWEKASHYWIYVHSQIQHVCMHIYLYYYCSNWNVRWCCAEAFTVGADLVGFCGPPIQHVDSFSLSSFASPFLEHSMDCRNSFIHIYEHWESMCSNIWEKRKRPFIHSHTIILKSMVFYFSAAFWAARFFFSATFYLDTYSAGTQIWEL